MAPPPYYNIYDSRNSDHIHFFVYLSTFFLGIIHYWKSPQFFIFLSISLIKQAVVQDITKKYKL